MTTFSIIRNIFYSQKSTKMSSGKIVLNVGGTIFETSELTLTKFDGFFKTILKTESFPIDEDQNPSIFVDRDPTHFRQILNYMRDGDIDLQKSSEDVREIQKEAQFYGLEGLMQLCSTELENREKFFDVSEDVKGTRSHRKLKFIESDDQYLQLIVEPEKAVFVFHYSSIIHGQMRYPYGLNIEEFLNKYRDQFEIYFKVLKPAPNTEVEFWKWSIHYYNQYYEGKEGFNYNVKNEVDRDIKHFLENKPFP